MTDAEILKKTVELIGSWPEPISFSSRIELIGLQDRLRRIADKLDKYGVMAERSDAEDWLGEHKDIWNHPLITDRTNKEAYEVADLMAEFANEYFNYARLDNLPTDEEMYKEVQAWVGEIPQYRTEERIYFSMGFRKCYEWMREKMTK